MAAASSLIVSRFRLPLKDRHVARLKRPGLHPVGSGWLYLCIDDTGARSWVLRTVDDGDALQDVELGSVTETSLEQARRRALDFDRIGTSLAGPERKVSARLRKEEVQKLTGQPYGKLLFETWQRESSKPVDGPLEKQAFEALQRELLQALLDREIHYPGPSSKPKFRRRKTPDLKMHLSRALEAEGDRRS